ncbi:hypothetical protein Bca52824_068630 [Brassica carinata]|uniref:Uncharacterized protein n=1 Tax=Brassica carinata TaxID=52824 RepID=A0A8X7Q0P4_BRACI|nr:hypothetical protein Bca52824_068630 [Brassica carinata]
MVPPATERRNKSSDPGPVPNVLRIKPSPFTAPDSGKVVIYPSSSGVTQYNAMKAAYIITGIERNERNKDELS